MNGKLFLILLAWCCAFGAEANQVDTKQSELDALKQRLQTLQQEYRDTQAHRKDAADELQQSERAISSTLRQLRRLEDQRQRAQDELQRLNQEAESTQERIRQQQAHLGSALNAAYLRGQGDALKLILNGADPNQSARDLRYLAYLSSAQQAQIDSLRADLDRLASLRQDAAQKNSELEQVHAARAAEQQKLLADRRARQAVLDKLSARIQEQRREISNLKRDERSLTQLVERLNRMMAQQAAREAARARAARQAQNGQAAKGSSRRAPVGVNTRTPEAFHSDQPFSRLKGLLRLPVAGELMNRFGDPREGGAMNWKGLFIRAAQGSAVKAIAAGRVVFAEWLRGFGNLIIVDHGQGYMSLYSNNESLYKQVGDSVQPGDTVASVGNSGGQPETGLYFELRHQSRPVNPLEWVK